MLDDLKFISEIDKSNMLDAVANFSAQLKESKDIVESSTFGSIYKIDDIVVSGMGASAIAGDFIQSLFRDRIDIPIHINRQYDLPKWTNKNTLLITQSYSGNTEETLSAFDQAVKKKATIISVASGGLLEKLSIKSDSIFIKIPEGLIPRAALPFPFFISAFILNKIFPISNFVNDIDEAIDEAEEAEEEFEETLSSMENQQLSLMLKTMYKLGAKIQQWENKMEEKQEEGADFTDEQDLVNQLKIALEEAKNDIETGNYVDAEGTLNQASENAKGKGKDKNKGN